MLTDRDERTWSIAVWIISLVTLFALYGICLLITNFGRPIFPNIQEGNLGTLLGIVTSFSITMVGFIAAIAAYLLSISKNKAFNEWRASGYLTVFFNIYGASIVGLIGTFALCVIMLLDNMNLFWLKLILSFVALNIIHILLTTYIVVNQAKAT
ncbi:hypothetical protein [Vibrio alginolyticus]|uniref:hypothetical protein n=1 Tax=Vibrio alginolyticus TaxID=663 RepID=UPI0006D9CEB5|nr:hypothetical protein [Vibrio alginolyticus]KPM97653.1 hypothetical protein AOG25_14195 [Vibrio alginolyticus]